MGSLIWEDDRDNGVIARVWGFCSVWLLFNRSSGEVTSHDADDEGMKQP
jgi:hypothetical protein